MRTATRDDAPPRGASGLARIAVPGVAGHLLWGYGMPEDEYEKGFYEMGAIIAHQPEWARFDAWAEEMRDGLEQET